MNIFLELYKTWRNNKRQKGGQFTSGKGRYNASYISPKRKCRDIEFVQKNIMKY